MKNAFRTFWRAPIREIETSRVLRAYGACLAFTHVLTVAQWLWGQAHTLFASGSEAVCWPFFENCSDYRLTTSQ
jgi:hypothetical protein